MFGNIYYIEKNHGFINGDNGNRYFFHKDHLLNCTIYQLGEGDRVEFSTELQEGYSNERAIKIRKKDAVNTTDPANVNPGINPLFKYNYYNADEIKIINKLKQSFYVTNGGEIVNLGNSNYRYCLVKPTNSFNMTFNLKREMVVVFSDYVSFEPRSLDVAPYVANQMQSKLRIDRGCQILISSDVNIEQKLVDVLKDNNLNSIVIPFSYQELLKDIPNTFIIDRFRKYLFDVDLFSSNTPVQNDLFFFGRRDYVFDIANKCKNNIHSGIFGLRRSGKTSLLYAVQRLLDNDNYVSVYIPCQSQLSKINWQLALYEIINSIKIKLSIRSGGFRSKQSYLSDNTSNSFESDLCYIYNIIKKPITLLFDEIETITFDVPGNDVGWKNGENYVAFWNIIRGYYLKHPNHLSIIIAGTNPMVNEIPVIGNGIVNPMYGQLSKANQGAYLLPFASTDTYNMVNTLGGYMGLAFDEDVCALLTSDCGGHPYLIRLLCSYINSYLKQQNIKRPKKISRPIYAPALKLFEETNEATGFYLMILNILVTSYPKEFNVLKEIAINGDEYVSKFVDDRSLLHLIGYGLIESDEDHYKIKFNTIERYLLGKYKFEKTNLDIEEQKQEIQYRINIVEIALRNLVKTSLLAVVGATNAKNIIIKAMEEHKAINEKDVNLAKTLTYSQLFDPSINKMYFSLLSKIIVDNYAYFNKIFNVNINTIKQHCEIINKSRRAPDHSYTEKSENWSYSDFESFRKSIEWIETILEI